MNVPQELKYSKTHEWVKMISETECEVGLTDFAQDSLGDLVFVNLPEVDDVAEKDNAICDVESVKAVSDVNAPVNGKVCAVNEALLDAPESINSDPYGAWLFQLTDVSGVEDLMDADAYSAFCEAEGH